MIKFLYWKYDVQQGISLDAFRTLMDEYSQGNKVSRSISLRDIDASLGDIFENRTEITVKHPVTNAEYVVNPTPKNTKVESLWTSKK